MKNNDPEKQLILSDDISRDIIHYEYNLFRWPLFFINKKDVGSQKILYIPIITDDGEGYWKVSPNVEYGAGGPFDDAVLTVIQKILTSLPKPIENPVDIGSLAEIARELKYKNTGGRVLNDIKKSLKRLASLLISSRFTYYDKSTKRFLKDKEGVFHILDRVSFVGETLENGMVSEQNLIWINTTFLRNINSWYVNPVDIGFYLELKDTERALFKLLTTRFFANRHNTNPVKFKYSTIVKLTTLSRRKQISQARQQLDPTHESLIKKGFLRHYEWNEIQKCKDDWSISYLPGKVAESHISLHVKASNKNTFLPLEYIDNGFNSKNLSNTPSTGSLFPAKNEDEVLKKLWDRGVLKTTAQNLILKYPLDFLSNVISYCDIIAETKEINFQYIIKTIEETSPEYIKNFLERYRKQAEADKKVDDSTKEKNLKQRYEDAMSSRILDYIISLPIERREELRQQAIENNKGLQFATPGSASYEITLSNEMEKIVMREKLVDLPTFESWSKGV